MTYSIVELNQASRLLSAIHRFAGNGEDGDLLSKIRDETPTPQKLIESKFAVLSQDRGGFLNFYNRGAQLVFGYDRPEIIGKPTRTLVPGEMMDDRTEMFRKVLEEDRLMVEETIRKHKNGSIIQIRGYVLPYDLDGDRCIAAVIEKLSQ